MAAVRHIGFYNFGFWWYEFCIQFQSVTKYTHEFIKIGSHFTQLWRYNNFQHGGRAQSWISKLWKFSHSTVIIFGSCILLQTVTKSDKLLPGYRQNDVINMACVCHLEFKVRILVKSFLSQSVSESDSVYQFRHNRIFFTEMRRRT